MAKDQGNLLSSRRDVLKTAIGLGTLAALGGCMPTKAEAGGTPSGAATAPATVTTPGTKLEQWMPSRGDFLSAPNLRGKTPQEIMAMGSIKSTDVKTVEDLGNQLSYRLYAMDYAGCTPEDLAPFKDADGQIGVAQIEAFIEANQKAYLEPLMQSCGEYKTGTDFKTSGIAQNNRAVLFDYALKQHALAVGATTGEDLKITITLTEAALVDGDLSGASSVVKLTFRKNTNDSKTTTGKTEDQKDVNQFETSLYKVTREGDHLLVQESGGTTVTPAS